MNTKVLAAFLLIGIATWAGLTNYLPAGGEKNLNVNVADIQSTLKEMKEDAAASSEQMGTYNAKASRKLTGVIPLGGLGASTASSDAQAAAVGGLASSIANAAAAALGNAGLATANGNAAATSLGGLATSGSNTAATVLNGGLASAIGNAAAAALGGTGSAIANGNAVAAGLGGLAAGNSGAAAFTAPGFSTSIANSGSVAIGNNAVSSSNAGSAASNIGGGLATANANTNAAALGLGLGLGLGLPSVSSSGANAAAATIGGNGFSTAKTVTIAQNFGSASLNGRYLFAVPVVTLTVTVDAFIFKGCNTYRVPYTRRGKSIDFGACEFQDSDCGYDHAYKLAQRLPIVTRYSRVGDGFAGYNNDDFEFFSVNERKVNKKRQVYSYFYEGDYDVQYPSYNIEVNNNQLYFQGHQDRPIDFEYSNDDTISFTKYFEKKRDFGLYDEDRAVADLFVSCAKVNRRGENKGYEFHDKKGRRLAECSPKKW